MATDLERLIVSLEARTKAFENSLNKANTTAQRRLKGIEKQFNDTNKKLVIKAPRMEGFGGLGGKFAGAAGLALAARQVQQYADAWTEAGNKIASASQISGRQARGLEELNDIASKTRSGITETVDLYAKLLRATKDVAKSEEEVARATEIVNKAFKAGGAASSEQAAGILQLSQALGSGILQGDELRSLRENAPLVAQAIADEFQTTIAGLKELGAEGQLTTDRVFKAILDAQPKIEAAFASTNATIGDSFTLLGNALTEAAGRIDAVTGLSKGAGESLGALVAVIGALTTGFESFAGTPAAKFIAFLDDAIRRLEPVNNGLRILFDLVDGGAEKLGADFTSGMDGLAKASKTISDINGAFDEFRSSVAEMKPEASESFDELQRQLKEGEISADAAKAALDRMFGDDPMFAAIKDRFAPLLDSLKEVVAQARMAQVAVTTLGGPARHNSSFGGVVLPGEAPKPTGRIDPYLDDPASSSSNTAAERAAKKAAKQIDEAIANQTSVAVDAASAYLGQNEKKNRGNINAFLKAGGVNLDAATTAWCAAFVNSALAQVGVTGSGSNVATDFLNWGVKVDPSKIQRGDVLVDPNGKSAGQTGGHVGLATGQVRFQEGILQVQMLSGNASNKVKEDWVNASEVVARRATDAVQVSADALDHISDASEAALKKQEAALKQQEQAYEQLGQIAETAMSGLVNALADGKIEGEELLQILFQIVQQLLTMPKGSLGSLFGGGGGGGGIGGLIGSLFGFANGGIAAHGKPLKTFARGGVSRSAAIFGEAGPEAAVPLPDGRRIPVDLRGPTGAGGASQETIRVVLQDDSGRMAEIADQQIRTRSGTIIEISTQQSVKAVRKQMPGLMANAQARSL